MPDNSAEMKMIYKQIFQECDTNNDGAISISELIDFIRSPQRTIDLSVRQIAYTFLLSVGDHSQLLVYEDFENILENPKLNSIIKIWMKRYINLVLPPQPVKTDDAQNSLEEDPLVKPPQTEPVREDPPIEGSEFSYVGAWPLKLAMVLISILQLVCFIADESDQPGSTLNGTGETGKIFLYEPAKRYEAWRFLSYMLIHMGKVQLIVNLAVQLLLGVPLEIVHKWWRVSVMYVSGVVAGSLATSVINPWSRLAGASGGVYALLTAHIASVIMNWSEMTFPALQLCILGVIISSDMGTSIYNRYYLKLNDQVDFAAYFGGALAGLLVGIYILENGNFKTFEKKLYGYALVLFAILMNTAILLNIFLPHRYPTL